MISVSFISCEGPACALSDETGAQISQLSVSHRGLEVTKKEWIESLNNTSANFQSRSRLYRGRFFQPADQQIRFYRIYTFLHH